MNIGKTHVAGAIGTLALILAARALAQNPPYPPTVQAEVLVKWCMDHPDNCSLSIDYAKGGKEWHIDYNGTRLNVLASAIKVVHVMTYADAVAHRQIDPVERVPLDEWARFWVGRDGGALAQAYAADGGSLSYNPLTVTNDQIVYGLIRYSDDAGPDYLLNKLGPEYFRDTVSMFIAGPGHVGHLELKPIGADFLSWWGNPASPNSGIAALRDYSGFASDEYRAELGRLFAKMHDRDYMAAVRDYEGILLPWQLGVAPPAHTPPFSEAQYEQLEKDYSMRSNTRTFNQFMKGLLNRDLGLSPEAQAIAEKFLEWRLAVVPAIQVPGVGPLNQYMKRYGGKDGSLSTDAGATVRTRTIYAESKDGTKVVFTVQLTGTPHSATDLGPLDNSAGSLDSAINNFAFALATDPDFAVEVQTNLKPDAPAPSLIARVVENTSTQQRVQVKVRITNIGTAPTVQALNIDLLPSSGRADAALFPPLIPGQTADVNLESRAGVSGGISSFELVIDPANVIPVGQKQDNPQFEVNLEH